MILRSSSARRERTLPGRSALERALYALLVLFILGLLIVGATAAWEAAATGVPLLHALRWTR